MKEDELINFLYEYINFTNSRYELMKCDEDFLYKVIKYIREKKLEKKTPTGTGINGLLLAFIGIFIFIIGLLHVEKMLMCSAITVLAISVSTIPINKK